MKTPEKAWEVNFDGLVGPTHHYAGLSYGNVASLTHRAMVSNPREAALQGLQKMKALHDQGFKQALLPPQERPDFSMLRRLGLSGSEQEILKQAAKVFPEVLSAVSSGSSMWTANAATVSPSADSIDQKVHFTAANLVSKFHRSIEPSLTSEFLKKIFSDSRSFVHHEPLPTGNGFGDEGAANHTRLCANYAKPGVQFFVYGKNGFSITHGVEPKKYPARQTREASESIARLHALKEGAVVFAQQHPAAIDAGAFHNDVVSVGNENFFFYHENAFLESTQVIDRLKVQFQAVTGEALHCAQVLAKDVSLADAVQSYLFNSQLLSLGDGKMKLIAPTECREVLSVRNYLDSILSAASTPIRDIEFFDLRQSMRNGGGPACLRLRVVLTETEMSRALPTVFLSDGLYASLVKWVTRHYRDRLSFEDLLDLNLWEESKRALDELTQILNLGSIYPFQKKWTQAQA